MADIQSNIQINVDTSNAMSAIRGLQAQISAFHQQMRKSGSAANAAASANMQRNLINSINATKKFSASIATVSTETESFTNALEKNKLSMGQYFRYAGASTRTFGRLFKGEFNTISQVAESRVRTLQSQYVKMGRDANGAMKAIKVRPLALDMNNLSTQTMIAAQKQQIFNQLLKQGSTNLLNFGKNTQWAGRQLMVGFTVPLSIMGSTAIKEFQKIEEQVIKLKRVYGDMFTTDAEVEKAVESVKTLADEFTKYGIAVESTIGLAASVAQMGNVGADMINQVTEATKLAVLGGMEQEKALDTTISLTNAFGIASENLTEKINFLNAAENQTILAIDDFTEAVPKAGAVVSQLGGSVEDLAFFLTAMREGGVNASQAANALKSSLARLVNPTQQAQEDLGKLGIDIVGIVENNVGNLRGTIMSLGSALDELQPLERSRALEELFGKFQFARMSTLFNNISREGSQAQEILRLTQSSAEELQALANRELKRVEESPATKLQKQVEKLQSALAPIGLEFMKLITPLIEFLTDMLKKFNSMGDGAKSFVTGLITVLGLIAPAAIMAFGLVANGIANLMKAFNSYRSFLQILSGANRDATTQTQYMTQEQLEAASVAVNLGQAHEYLARQFTVEASALAQLADVYRQATAEQLRYNAASTGTPARMAGKSPTKPPKKYADGVVMVPGPKGAGDIVPAMLSPGEAVIPAKKVAKYRGLIQAMISGNIPGYSIGYLDDPGTDRRAPFKTAYDISNKNVPGSGQQTVEQLRKANVSITEARKIMKGIAEVSSQGAAAVKNALQSLEQGIQSGLKGGKLTSDFRQKTGTGKPTGSGVAFAHVGSGASMSKEQLLAEADAGNLNLTAGERKKLEARSAGSMIDVKSGLGMAGFNQTTNAKLAGKGVDISEFAEAYDTAGPEKWNKSIEFGGGKIDELSDQAAILDNEMRELTASVQAGTQVFDSEKDAQNYRQQTGKPADSVERLYSQARTNVKGRAGGLVKALDTAQQTPTEVRITGTSPGDKGRKIRGGKLAALVKQAKQEAQTYATAFMAEKKKALSKESNDSYTQSRSKKRNSPHPQAKKDGKDDAMAYGTAKRKESAKQNRKEQAMANRQRRSQVAGRLAGGMGAASMAIGMATMMPGVGNNPVMQQIQGLMPIMFAMSAILPMLAALPGPLGLLVGAVGLVAGGLYMWNKELKKTREENRKLGESMTAGKDTMQAFAEAAGVATPTEIMDLRRQGVGEQVQYAVGKTPFATQFYQGEAGQEMVSSFQSASSNLGPQAAAAAASRQLTTAVASGILSKEQAGQLALELGNQLNDFGVTMKVAGDLNEMFGPNGEDLLNGEPLEIFIKTSEASSQAFIDSLSSAADALGGGGFLKDFLGLNDAAVAGFVSGTLTGFIEEQQGAMDAFEVQSSKRMESLEAERDQMLANGKDVSEINAKIAREQADYDAQRTDALNVYQSSFKAAADRLRESPITDEELMSTYGSAIDSRAVSMFQDGGYSSFEEARQASMDIQRQALGGALSADVMASLVDGFKAQIDENIPESMRDAAKGAIDSIAAMDLDLEAKLLFTSGIASGSIDPVTLGIMNSMFAEGEPGDVTKYFNIIGEVMLKGGPQATAQISAVLRNISDFESEENKLDTTTNFLNEVKQLEGTDLTNVLDQITRMSTYASLLPEGALLKYIKLPEDAKRDMQDAIDAMQELVDSTPDEPLTVDQVLEQKVITDPSAIAAFKANADYFEKLDPVQQVLYIETFITAKATMNEEQAIASLASRGVRGDAAGAAYNATTYTAEQITSEIARNAGEIAERVTEAAGAVSNFTDGDGADTSGGGAVGSMLDSITEKLKLVRDETVKTTKGWGDSLAQLQNLFGGNKTISIFDGINQQLRRLGANENLINLIAGMDPDEFEERKNDLFTINNGQITALKDAAISIGDALNSIKIGEFQNEQEKLLSNMESQEVAFQMLRDAGLDVAEAYGVIADEALAAAIASGQLTDNEIDELIRKVEQVRERSDIADAFETARKAIEEFNDELRLEANVRAYVDSSDFAKIKGTLVDGQVDGALASAAILKDESLKALMLAGRAGSEEFATRLKQLMSDADFLQGIFDKGYANVQEAFRVQEAKIADDFETRLIEGTLANYDFNDLFGLSELSDMIGMSQDEIEELFKLKDPEGVVEQAKAQIATLEYQVDDLNAELRDIEQKEENINEKYDERIDALDKVERANAQISRQQQAQLGVADALSRGDIAAAARAAQEARQQEAQARLEDRKTRIEEARERELALVRSEDGNSRKELEEQIRDIENEIFDIQEKQLEPAQRLLELSGLLMEKQIEYDTVLGMTREAWEDVKLEIDLAKISSQEYNNAIQAALDSVGALIEAYGRLGDAIAAAYSRQTSSSGGGGGVTPTTTPKPTPTPPNEGDGKRELDLDPKRTGGSEAQDLAGQYENEGIDWKAKAAVVNSNNAQKRNDAKNEAAKAKAPSTPPKNAPYTYKDTGQTSTYNPGGVQYKRVKVTTPYGAYYKTVAVARGGMIKPMKLAAGGPVRYSMGGAVARYAMGGMTPLGSDSVPAMLTPGEFVIRRPAVQSIGKDRLEEMNKTGTSSSGSVYNYNLEVNVKSDSNPDDIARTVMSRIRQVESQRVRGNRF